jgi:hypothetical protein
MYTTDVVAGGTLVALDPTLNWGDYLDLPTPSPLYVVVEQNLIANDTACLSEQSGSGTWYAIGSLMTSSTYAAAGTYYQSGSSDPCVGANPITMGSWLLSFP